MSHASEAQLPIAPLGYVSDDRRDDVRADIPSRRSTAWAGVAVLVLIEATVLLSLIASYYYLRTSARFWPPPGVDPPSLALPTAVQALIVGSAASMAWALRRRRRGGRVTAPMLLGGAVVTAALVLQGIQYGQMDFSWQSHAYGSMVWTISGYSAMHVLVLLGFAVTLVIFERRSALAGSRPPALEAAALYWYFVAVTSPLTFATLYISPYVL